jgi:hypothetical protein
MSVYDYGSRHNTINYKFILTVYHMKSSKYSQVLLRMGEIFAWNMQSWFERISKTEIVASCCLYCYISNARSHKHQGNFFPPSHSYKSTGTMTTMTAFS